MPSIRALLARAASPLRRRRLDTELDEEIAFHVAQLTEENVRRGLDPVEAAAEARREFGGVQQVKEAHRDVRGLPWIEEAAHDLRYACRMFIRAPGFTAVALLMLALGIGATTAIFTVVNAILLQPLPYPEPDRLVVITRRFPRGDEGRSHTRVRYEFLREHVRSFQGRLAAMHGPTGYNLSGPGGEPEYVDGMSVSAEFFPVLGVRPAHGRGFTAEEDSAGGPDAVVLGHDLWRRRFAGDPDAVGKTIHLGDRPHTIVGVMPSAFRAMDRADLWTPLRPLSNPKGGGSNYRVLGRLARGVTLAQTQSDIQTVVEAMRREFPKIVSPRESAGLLPYKDFFTSRVEPPLMLLLAGVAVILLIACANVANLLLARASGRARELGIRAALGAGRGRIVRQLLVESLILAFGAGAVGVLLAHWAVPPLMHLAPPEYARWSGVGIDWRVLAGAIGVSAATGIAFGMVPAVTVLRTDLTETFRDETARTTAARRTGGIRSGLVVAEVTVCVVLLVAAALLIRTFVALRNVPLGFEPRGVVTAQMSMQGERYADTARLAAFYDEALRRIQEVPRVEAAAVVSGLPVERGLNMPVDILDGPRPEEVQLTDWRYATPDYFRVMRIPLLAGRALDDRDRAGATPAAVVNQAFARRFFPGAAPINRHVRVAERDSPVMEIVGVVGDVEEQGLGGPPVPVIFVPMRQAPDAHVRIAHSYFQVSWVVRTRDGGDAAREIERAVRSVDRDLPFSGIRTMDAVIGATLRSRRFEMLLLTLFGGLALALAAGGIYGVMSYTVLQRTHEIGIRMALGATARELVAASVRQGVLLAGFGVVAGLALAAAATRLLRTFVFGVTTTDPMTFAVVAAVFLLVAFVAALLPSWRITRLDPAGTLRRA